MSQYVPPPGALGVSITVPPVTALDGNFGALAAVFRRVNRDRLLS